jgi:hypothetical protein
MQFRIAEGLTISYEEYRQEGLRISILARSGAGKSNLAALFIEQALEQGLQICIIEPIREWYTLKASFDNVIWAGEDGDIPLVPECIHMYADLLEQGASLVLTVALDDDVMEKEAVATFLREIYRRWGRMRRPMLLVLEEADVWAPQMWTREDRKCLKRVIDIAKRGRKLGINTILITQRPADIHKTALAQSNLLFIGGFHSKPDLETIKQLSNLLKLEIPTSDLARLGPGTFYAIYGGEITRIHAYMRKTPHGGETPPLRTVRHDIAPQLDTVRAAIEDVLKQRREEQSEIVRLRRENNELRERIAELERQLEAAKIVKEIPIEIKATGPVTAPTVPATNQQIPEAVLTSPYPQTAKIWLCLAEQKSPTTLKALMTKTGLGYETTKRIVKYLRNKGLVKVKTRRMGGRVEAIRFILAKPTG